MKKIALVGAGGKMGRRLAEKLHASSYDSYFIEISESGVQYLQENAMNVNSLESVVDQVDIIILAIPDVAIQKVAANIVPKMKPQAMLMTLDPAAAYMGYLPKRDDVSYFITHPCHTNMFNDEVTPEAKKDYFGGVAAKQSIVCALMQGPEHDFEIGEDIAKLIYAPVLRSHRVTVEQMAILEPGLSETVCAMCAVILKEATDEAARRGVPYAAAQDFVLGHLFIETAIAFGIVNAPFSDACYVAIDYGKKHILQKNWLDVFSPDKIKETVDYMLHPQKMEKGENP